MEQNRKFRKKSMHLHPVELLQRYKNQILERDWISTVRMKLNSCHLPVKKLKRIKALNVRPEIMKLLEENIGETLQV
jgi:hypothetical protein